MAAALLALAAYTVIALALFPSVVAHLTNAFPGDLGDPPSQAWILAWDVHALATNPAHLYDANIFYPFHDVLAYQDTLLGLLPFAAPVLLLTGNAVLAYNVLFLLSFALCAWGAFLLARLLVGDGRAAFLAGPVYGFSPYRMVHLYHLNLLSGMWIPFALLCWERVRRGERRHWVGVGVFFVLQALSALYYAAFLAVALALLLLLHLRTARERRPLLVGAAVTACACGAALLPFFIPYMRVEHALGASRGLGQAVYFAADLRDFLHSVDLSVLYGWTGHALGVGPDDALQYLWPGALALALALASLRLKPPRALPLSLVTRRGAFLPWDRRLSLRCQPGKHEPARSRRSQDESPPTVPGPLEQNGSRMGAVNPGAEPRRSYVILCALAAVLCLGPFLKVWGLQTGLPLPYLLLYPLPGFAGLRDPARFGAIYTLALAVLAAYGATALLARLPRRATLVATFLCIGVLAESWIRPLPAVTVPVGAAVPPVYRWLAAQPAGRPVLELPIGLGNKAIWAQQAEMMYYATYHWQPIVDGTGGFAPPGYAHDVPLYNAFPAPASLRLLRARHVRYVVVHRLWLGPTASGAIRARVAHTRGVRLVASWPDADLYALSRN